MLRIPGGQDVRASRSAAVVPDLPVGRVHHLRRDPGCIVFGLAETAQLAPLLVEGEQEGAIRRAVDVLGQVEHEADLDLRAVLARHDVDGHHSHDRAEPVTSVDPVIAPTPGRDVRVRWSGEDPEQLARVLVVVHDPMLPAPPTG